MLFTIFALFPLIVIQFLVSLSKYLKLPINDTPSNHYQSFKVTAIFTIAASLIPTLVPLTACGLQDIVADTHIKDLLSTVTKYESLYIVGLTLPTTILAAVAIYILPSIANFVVHLCRILIPIVFTLACFKEAISRPSVSIFDCAYLLCLVPGTLCILSHSIKNRQKDQHPNERMAFVLSATCATALTVTTVLTIVIVAIYNHLF